jgi:hypothetical protein
MTLDELRALREEYLSAGFTSDATNAGDYFGDRDAWLIGLGEMQLAIANAEKEHRSGDSSIDDLYTRPTRRDYSTGA